jgi:hypothetical protein
MMVRPTTEQLLLDCCKELMQGVLPAVSDQTAVVRIFMIEQVLRNAAVRCAHEIAWMDEEIPVIDSYARAVLQVAPREELVALLRRLNEAETGLDLDVVVERYCRAGEVLAAALEIAVTDELTDLRQRGEQLLDARHARENVVLAGWSPTGR